ncbi:Esterase EstD [compost metagenome]
MLAPQLATLAPDVSGIILAAAPARKLTDIIVEQNHYFFSRLNDTTAASQKQFEEVIKNMDRSRITQLGGLKPDSLIMGLPASYWISLNAYDQVETAKKLNKRIFVVQGGTDFQVSKADYDIWDAALGKKITTTLRFYPALNHLLSEQAEKGTTEQYQQPANVSEKLIDDLGLWLKKQPLSKE